MKTINIALAALGLSLTGQVDGQRHGVRDLRDARLDLCRDPAGQSRHQSLAARRLPELAVPPGTVSLVRVRRYPADTRNGGASGRIRWIEHLGDQNHLHIEIGKHSLVTLVDTEAPIDISTEVAIELVHPLCLDTEQPHSCVRKGPWTARCTDV
jgi:hypothetical protein